MCSVDGGAGAAVGEMLGVLVGMLGDIASVLPGIGGEAVDKGAPKSTHDVLHFLGHKMSTADAVPGSALHSLRLHSSGSSGNLSRHVGADVGETLGMLVGMLAGITVLPELDGEAVDKGAPKSTHDVLHFLGHNMSTTDGVAGSALHSLRLHSSGSSGNLSRHDGVDVGIPVGNIVGPMVGLPVGAAVGENVGLKVGVTVGPRVGAFVGLSVGF